MGSIYTLLHMLLNSVGSILSSALNEFTDFSLHLVKNSYVSIYVEHLKKKFLFSHR